MADTAILYKGASDIALALLMILQPELAYQNPLSQWIHSVAGYKIANPLKDPGFSQGVAFLLLVIGIGHVVASRAGAAARPTIFAMNAATALLAVGSSALQKESGAACTMTFAMAIIETLFTGLLFSLGAAQGLCPGKKDSKRE